MYSIIQPTMNKGYMQFTLEHIYNIIIMWCISAIPCQQVCMLSRPMKMRAVLGRQYTCRYSCVSLCSLWIKAAWQYTRSLFFSQTIGLVANKALLCQHMWPDGLQMRGGAVSHDVSACHQRVSVITNQLSSWKLGILRMKWTTTDLFSGNHHVDPKLRTYACTGGQETETFSRNMYSLRSV